MARLQLAVIGALAMFAALHSAAAESLMTQGGEVDAPDTTCGGNCPSNDCSSCPCGTTTSYVDISEWCSKFSEWDQGCCRCIVSHESSGNAHAVNQNTGGSLDVGVWQVNSFNWGSCSGGNAPCDPSTNLQCAIDVWRWGGGSFKLWSTCGECGCC